MPHIIVEYSSGIGPEFNVPELLKNLHNTLGAEESVNIERVKTRAIVVHDYRVGNGDKEMVHITLKVMPRDVDVMKRWASNMQSVAQKFAPTAAVTAEIVILDKDTYCL